MEKVLKEMVILGFSPDLVSLCQGETVNSEKNVLVEVTKVSVKGSSPKLVKLETQPKQILYGKRYI